MPIIWNRVTWYSKLLSVVVLLIAIAITHYFYIAFQKVGEAYAGNSPLYIDHNDPEGL
jgi:hypothetical protein